MEDVFQRLTLFLIVTWLLTKVVSVPRTRRAEKSTFDHSIYRLYLVTAAKKYRQLLLINFGNRII